MTRWWGCCPKGGQVEVRVTGGLRGCPEILTCAVRDTIRLVGSRSPAAAAVTLQPVGRVELYGARPNPFRPGGRIGFGLPRAGAVTLEVFDVRGRLVETLVEGALPAGRHQLTWDAAGVAPGVYFVQLRSGGAREYRRLVVMRK